MNNERSEGGNCIKFNYAEEHHGYRYDYGIIDI